MRAVHHRLDDELFIAGTQDICKTHHEVIITIGLLNCHKLAVLLEAKIYMII